MLQVLTDPWLTIFSRPGLWLTILSRPSPWLTILSRPVPDLKFWVGTVSDLQFWVSSLWLTFLSRPGLWLTILSRPGLFVVGWCVNLALRRICRNLSFKFPRLRNDPSWPCVSLSSKQWCFSFSSKAEIQTSFKTLILHLPKVPS